MSLHTLANHMSAHGRGPDSTLVHMSPREVQGLQALAMRHGGSLTINPQTGLPEAGILESILPAVAGFALNAFAPGIGGAVGSALGLGEGLASTVGTGLLVGGVTGLASGSLEKGLMAGLGAYGGAGLGSSLVGAGSPSVAMDAASGARDAGMSAAAQASPAATAARLQAGANTAMSAPMDFLSNNKWNLAAAAAPAFIDAFGGDDKEETAAPKQQSGNLYMYKKDPATGQSYAYETYSGDEVKNAPPVRFGNAGGGLMRHYDEGGPVKFGNATDAVDANGNPITPATEKTISDSQRAQDYLLGKPGAVNPFLFYHKGPAAAAALSTAPVAALSTAGISALTSGDAWSNRGGPGVKEDPNPEWTKKTDEEKTLYFSESPNMLGFQEGLLNIWSATPLGRIQHAIDPSRQNRERAIIENAKAMRAAREAIANPTALPGSEAIRNMAEQYAMYNNPNAGIVPAPVEAPTPEGAISTPVTYGPITTTDLPPSSDDLGGYPVGDDSNDNARSNTTYSANYGGTSYGSVAPGYTGGSEAARGGLMDSRYAHGGITALAQGGMYNLGSYSDGGRLLKGPGDGVSDDIPATIGQNQPARLADGEFVVPARIVSELGNGSTEAGARKLYAMMDRVQKARSKTVGKNKVAANSRADKYLPV